MDTALENNPSPIGQATQDHQFAAHYYDTHNQRVISRPEWYFDGGIPVSDEYLAEHGLYPLHAPTVADVLATYTVTDGYEVVDGIARPIHREVARSLDEAKSLLKSRATQVRKSKETGGVILNGSRIETDRESQAMINGAVSFVQINPSLTIDFKGENGWMSLDASTMLVIGQAVAAHVQACFSKERALHEAIDASADIAALEAIDIESGWPGQEG